MAIADSRQSCREHIPLVLASTGNNVMQVAKIFGICVATLWRRIKKHKIPT